MGPMIFIGCVGAVMALLGAGVWSNAKSAVHEIEALVAIGFGLLIVSVALSTYVLQAAIRQVAVLTLDTNPKPILETIRRDLASAQVSGLHGRDP